MVGFVKVSGWVDCCICRSREFGDEMIVVEAREGSREIKRPGKVDGEVGE